MPHHQQQQLASSPMSMQYSSQVPRLRAGKQGHGAPGKPGWQEFVVWAVNQWAWGSLGRSLCWKKWSRLMPAPTGEQTHSRWCSLSAASLTKDTLLSLKCVIMWHVAPSWWEKREHLIETNNCCVLNFSPIIHANVPGECPFVQFFPFSTAYAFL